MNRTNKFQAPDRFIQKFLCLRAIDRELWIIYLNNLAQ